MKAAATLAIIVIMAISACQALEGDAAELPVSTAQINFVVDQQVVSAGVRSIESYVESRPEFVKNPTWVSKKTYANGVVRFEVKDLAARVATGAGATQRFNAGESVAGEIKLDNGKTHSGCWLEVSPTGGSVTSGVINGWYAEVSRLPSCSTGVVANQPAQPSQPAAQQPAVAKQRLTAEKGPVSYGPGDAAVGFISGKSPQPCAIKSATDSGTVIDGVVHRGGVISEWSGEISKFPACN